MFRCIIKNPADSIQKFSYQAYTDEEFAQVAQKAGCTMPLHFMKRDYPLFIETEKNRWDWVFQWKFSWEKGTETAIHSVPGLLLVFPDGPNSDAQFKQAVECCGIKFH